MKSWQRKSLWVCAFVLAGSSMAGSVESGLPGIGTFAYSGPPITAVAPLVVATNDK